MLDRNAAARRGALAGAAEPGGNNALDAVNVEPDPTALDGAGARTHLRAVGAQDAAPTHSLRRCGTHHARMLLGESAISEDVALERGYRSVGWTLNDQSGRRELTGHGIPSWARKADRGEGLLIPIYGPSGQRTGVQWRPDTPVKGRSDGKRPKYVMPQGVAGKLDVHPRNRSRIADPTVELWITEGVKKADALTSAGMCVIALAGVFNWRSTLGTLGDWEDVPLRGRPVVIAFDADALTKPDVLRAMQRLGRWLRSRQAAPVYLVNPAQVNGREVKGADDYLAAGGNVSDLRAAAVTHPPNTTTTDDTFSDARMAETVAHEVLDGEFLWVAALGWFAWDGVRWRPECSEATVTEAVRQWLLDRFAAAADRMKVDGGQASNASMVDGWRSMLGAGRMRAAITLARGIVERRADELDAHPDLLNTPAGVADLTTGDVLAHDPELLLTKVTRGRYVPGCRHDDWDAASGVLPPPEWAWLRRRLGQAVTGHPTPDGRLILLQGTGENGKSLVTTDGVVPALGDYGDVASAKLMAGGRGTEHSTEMADLRGQRLLVAEEMTEGRALDVTTLKRVQDVGTIKARKVHRDNMTFRATHSLFMTTNYRPVVNETDHGTWRRLALVEFPFTFRKPGEPLERTEHRRGDPGLKRRIRDGADGQHDAIVTDLVAAAVEQNADAALLEPTVTVAETTRAWQRIADRVLGYWDERLVADPGACVRADELLVDFNAWLAENGHQPWTRETFAPRFGEHAETRSHGVVRARVKNPAGLWRRTSFGWTGPVIEPGQVWAWKSLRPRTEADDRGGAAVS